MTLPLLVRRSLRQHALSTAVTALSLSLAGGLLMTVWVMRQQARQTFERMDGGWDAVLGARSSKLQLVLNAIFHLEASPGNIKATDVALLASNPAVRAVVPIAMGDNYQGFRIVGVTTNLFAGHEYAPGHAFKVGEGRVFEDNLREAVVGSFAARKLGFKVGTEFQPYHGLNYSSNPRDNVQHEDTYVVVGILEPSNTPADRVVWIPVAGLQNMAGHDPSAAEDYSAALVKLRDPAAGFRLDQLYNKQGDRLTFAWPIGTVMAQLFDKIGWFDKVLALVAWLVAVVAAASVLASIYNSMSARRRDIAILRALGAGRGTVFASIVLEAASVAAMGAMGGFVVHLGLLAGAGAIVRAQTGVLIEPFQPGWVWLWAPAALVGLAALAGVVPAFKAYKVDVASSLAPDS
ncbi:MAG: ABC transporter permease [Verrucomicrobiota bacterium]|jgi:putative ABC transport system permease protein